MRARFTTTLATTLTAALALAACMEPQVAPDLSARASSAFQVTELAGGLDAPWSVAPLAGGGALVTEKRGRLLRIGADGAKTEITGLPTNLHYVDDPQSQAGLFDVVPASDFADSGTLFISHAFGTPDSNGTALVRAQLVGDRLEGVQTLFESSLKSTNAHYGAKIVELPGGDLLLSTGDAFVLREEAQNSASTHGKVVRVDSETGESAVFTLGHRNVQGLALDRATGAVWEHEHGPRGGDELNRLEAGSNYGWPIVTQGVDYNGLRISPFETSEAAGGGFADPVHGWTPSVAPSGLTIYQGALFPEWRGDALVGALAGRSLRRVDLEGGQAVGEEVLLGDLGARIRDVREAPDGSVWVLTNEAGESGTPAGRLLRLAPGSSQADAQASAGAAREG